MRRSHQPYGRRRSTFSAPHNLVSGKAPCRLRFHALGRNVRKGSPAAHPLSCGNRQQWLLGRRERIHAICGLINHEVAVLVRKTREFPPKPGSIIPLPSIIEKTVTLRSGIKITPDQLITALLDSVVYPLDEALQAPEKGTPPEKDLFDEVSFAFTVANQYRIASDYWQYCLWGSKFLDRQASGRILIRPRDSTLARQAAISEQRYQSQLFAGSQHCVRMWRHRLTTLGKKAAVIGKGVVEFDPERRNRFKIAVV